MVLLFRPNSATVKSYSQRRRFILSFFAIRVSFSKCNISITKTSIEAVLIGIELVLVGQHVCKLSQDRLA